MVARPEIESGSLSAADFKSAEFTNFSNGPLLITLAFFLHTFCLGSIFLLDLKRLGRYPQANLIPSE